MDSSPPGLTKGLTPSFAGLAWPPKTRPETEQVVMASHLEVSFFFFKFS